jgi:hypothetical protein
MKKVIWFALLMPCTLFGQIAENFESGNTMNWIHSTAGRWDADTTASLSGRYSLHHIFDNPDAGIDRTGIRVPDLHPSEGSTKWSFLVRHGYDPSSSNNWSVFLMSDAGPDNIVGEGGARGFVIGVNFTGSDDTLRLCKVNGNQVIPVINCRINWQTDIGIANSVKIAVSRSPEGNWTVSVFRRNGELIRSVSGFDNELFSSGWFEVLYRYSSTRDRLLWIDDINIEGVFYADKEAPSIVQCESSGRHSVKVTLSESPAAGLMIPENISLNSGENKAISVIKKTDLIYDISFEREFINRSLNSLVLRKLCDFSGNCSQDLKTGFVPSWAERGDVVISEIMADPTPEVSLPGKEYIEITNRTGFPFNLKNWRLSASSQYSLFPDVSIEPSGIMILCSSQDTSLFKKYGRVAGLKQFPSLTDGGKLLSISDSSGTLIHGVEYSSSWYDDDLKSAGGWSLEMIDIRFPFYSGENWKASLSRKGGTPGLVNSVSAGNPDISFKGIENVFPDDSLTIRIRFSEPVFSFPGNLKSIRVGETGIIEIVPADPLFREFLLKPAAPLHGTEIYHLEISSGISDFAGNLIQKFDFNFGLSETAESGDILFNEVLFNPLPGDPDYIEFYNCSKKVLNASRLQVAAIIGESGDKSEPVPVADEQRCILPGEYYSITTNSKKVIERYFSADQDHLFETMSLPSMPDDGGHLFLYNRELDLLDEFQYSEDMHYKLFSAFEGVALEKVSPVNKSEVPANWHSASESSGWGTPGAKNSVFAEIPQSADRVVLSSSKISPDNDGYEDLLTIRMNLAGNGNVISATVFDETGSYIRKLASNLLAGAEASVIWDGTADDGSLVRTGIYILLITLYDDTGKTEHWKKVCTVIIN